MSQRTYAVLYGLDVAVGGLIWGNVGESISAHLAAEHGMGHWWCVSVNWVAWNCFNQPNHCRDALNAYEAREKAAPYGQ